MKSKQKTEYNKDVKPYVFGAANNLQDTVRAAQPGLDAITGGLNSGFATLGNRVFGSNALTDQAKSYAGDVLGGKYLGAGNPYLEGMVDTARGNAFDDVASRFGRTGMTGGTGFARSLGRGMGEAELGLRYNDYAGERARMDGMANNAGQISISDLAALPAWLQTAGLAAETPYIGANVLASGLGGLFGNQQTTTQKQGALGTIAGLVGSGLSAYASGGR